jgi:hypothetical protein
MTCPTGALVSPNSGHLTVPAARAILELITR